MHHMQHPLFRTGIILSFFFFLFLDLGSVIIIGNSSASNVLKTRHDTVKNSIGNIR
jgi:hypothetical protein